MKERGGLNSHHHPKASNLGIGIDLPQSKTKLVSQDNIYEEQPFAK